MNLFYKLKQKCKITCSHAQSKSKYLTTNWK